MNQPNFIAAYLVDPQATPNPLILLLKRSKEVYLPGIWQIVTGKVERDQKETVLQTLKREVFEETGIVVQSAYNVNVTLFYDRNKDQVGYSANFLIFLDHKQKVELSEKEHSECSWVSFEEAQSRLAFSTQKETLAHMDQYYIKSKIAQESLIIL